MNHRERCSNSKLYNVNYNVPIKASCQFLNYSWTKNGFAICSEPSTGDMTTRPGPLHTTKPNDLVSSVVLNVSSGSRNAKKRISQNRIVNRSVFTSVIVESFDKSKRPDRLIAETRLLIFV